MSLTREEIALAAHAGVMRRVLRLDDGDRYGAPSKPWDADIEGVAAEMVVAKAYNRYFAPVSRRAQGRGEPDVAGWQIRHTRRLDGSLLIHPRDVDEQVFILVVGCMPELTLAGWMHAAEGKRDEWWRERPRPAWFVPQTALRPMPERRSA